jgi:hypothetical protein
MPNLRRRRTARIVIELDLDRPHLAGVMTGSGVSRSFMGWLELTAAMDAAESDARFEAAGTARRAAQRREAAPRLARA